MKVEELRSQMMKKKVTNPKESKVYMAILSLSQLIAKEDKNREVTEKDIVTAALKEMKMAHQSKTAGAPYNSETFAVCKLFLPKMMTEYETEIAIESIINTLPEKSMKMMGKVMGILSKEYGDILDKGIASKKVKEFLNS